MAGLPNDGLGVGVGNKYVPLHADRRAARKCRPGLRRATALFERRLVGVDIGFRGRHRPSVTKCRPSSPAKVEPISFDEPYQNGGCGCCNGRSAIGTFS